MRHILILIWIFFLISKQISAQDGYEQIRSDQVTTIDGKRFFVHQVKKGQTLYSISKAYNVTMQEVIDFNPQIKKGLKTNQTLLIPGAKAELPLELPPLEEPLVLDPLVVDVDDPQVEEPLRIFDKEFPETVPCGMLQDSKKEVYNVALMMHLFLQEADTINPNRPTQQEIESYKSLRYIQFYEGFLLAVDSLRKAGFNLNLFVYSLEANPSATYALLDKPEMIHMDLIVGMLYNRNFEIVASWSEDHQIPIVSPVSERESQVVGNPMVIKIRPSASSEGIAVAEYISNNHRLSHTLLIRSWEEEGKKMADQIYSNCQAMGLDITPVSQENLISKLKPEGENVVVVVSRQKSFVLNVLSQLNADTNSYNITLFGLPRWDQIEGIDFQYLEKVRGHIAVPSWIDYRDPAVKRFVKLFMDKYKTDPESLAFQGYDVAWYFLNALKQYGTGFTGCLREITVRPLQTSYKFRQMNRDGWENHHWEMFRYDNYSLTPLN
ncbi:MAG: ABC transporter substrate-binding protein [Bacteroidales bacterium]|nr:ABC transporter substrate-binding protein [Bacteroidales bacterium]